MELVSCATTAVRRQDVVEAVKNCPVSVILQERSRRMAVPATDEAKIIYTGPSRRGWHRLQQAAECLQKYAWKYEGPRGKKQPEIKSPALAKGSLIHLALAQHYARMRARQQGESEADWVSPEEAVELIARLEGVEEYVEVVLETYRAYKKRYPEDERRWKIVDMECLMETKIAGKYLFTGRLDLTYEDKAGRIWVVDHKTTSRLTGKHKQFYAVSGQLLGYSHMAREKYGDRYAGLQINLIEHTNLKFDRCSLPRSPNFESRFEQIVVDIEESIERYKGRDYEDWPKAMNEMTCYGRYGACKFIEQCRWGKDAKKGGNWSIDF